MQRHFRETFDGKFSNPETGRYVLYHAHDTVKHDLAVPGDLSTGATRITGLYIRMWSPDGGTVLSDTGTYVEDPGTFDLLFAASGHHPADRLRLGPVQPSTRSARRSTEGTGCRETVRRFSRQPGKRTGYCLLGPCGDRNPVVPGPRFR